jgi:hypothetical protein
LLLLLLLLLLLVALMRPCPQLPMPTNPDRKMCAPLAPQ